MSHFLNTATFKLLAENASELILEARLPTDTLTFHISKIDAEEYDVDDLKVLWEENYMEVEKVVHYDFEGDKEYILTDLDAIETLMTYLMEV